jgi:hypothetical protein
MWMGVTLHVCLYVYIYIHIQNRYTNDMSTHTIANKASERKPLTLFLTWLSRPKYLTIKSIKNYSDALTHIKNLGFAHQGFYARARGLGAPAKNGESASRATDGPSLAGGATASPGSAMAQAMKWAPKGTSGHEWTTCSPMERYGRYPGNLTATV